MHAAFDAGLNLIDTAPAYGESEAVLGRALRQAQRREHVILATKVGLQGLRGEALRRQMLTSLETSLQTLQTDYLDIWQIHNLDAPLLEQLETIAGVFAEARGRGLVRWVGASTYGVEMPLAALETGLFDTLQVTYSVLDQRLADRVFPLAAERNVGLIVRSVLLQGALTGRGDYLPDHLEPLRARSRRFRQVVVRLRLTKSGLGLSPAQVALAFGLAHPHPGAVLVGVRTGQELSEDLQALSVTLPADLLAELYALRLDDDDLLNPGAWHGLRTP